MKFTISTKKVHPYRKAFTPLLTALFLIAGVTGIEAAEYDPNSKVYCDALWFRVHAGDCPELILKEEKKTMTLEEADKAGARLGESGQSGRTNCCLMGYNRKYPVMEIPDDAFGVAQVMKKGPLKWHLSGCHRFVPKSNYARLTKKEALDSGCRICDHCVERGPSNSIISDEGWKLLPSDNSAPMAGREPTAFSADRLPSPQEIEFLIQETLAQSNGIQERHYVDPVASVENFMTLRFFFPVHNWLDFYKAYRATGDKRILHKLRESARNYDKLSVAYPSAARLKASDPEGLAYMYSMAAYSRIIMQSGKKDINSITVDELKEAESMIQTMVFILKPICEGDDNLEPEMGIPHGLADDFRSRAFNRALNGIGTLAMLTAALEDLQAVTDSQEYQPTIDRYRKVVGEYIKHWFSIGHICTKLRNGEGYFYPYSQGGGDIPEVNGCRLYGRSEDVGHYSHSLQGVMLLYETLPELGIDDGFMTAVANTIYYNATTKIKVKGKNMLSGYVDCPTQARENPTTGGHLKGGSAANARFYMLQAFRDDMIDGLCDRVSRQKAAELNAGFEQRLATLHAFYMKALRADRSLIHLGEKM
ncbi:MAG TPA: hypothetical protein DCX06_03975 [Opitutae bacterium]|nr:hypothetical protein [Opitutae bacterium]